MLHLRQDNRFNSADNGIGMNYTLTEPNVLPIWEHARQLKGFKVLAYNGDTDPGINSSARPAVAVVAALRSLCLQLHYAIWYAVLTCLWLRGTSDAVVTQDKFFDYFDSINVTETEAWRPWTIDGKSRMVSLATDPGQSML